MKKFASLALVLGTGLFMIVTTLPAQANHSWDGYHWARTSNTFTLKLGDNVTSAWDGYLAVASTDWSASSVLDTAIVAGSSSNVKRCSPPKGRVEICNAKYGFNGWLGIAGITISGGHITSGYVKLNDSYYGTATYNSPAWRAYVMCQEIGHAFGLDHTDENMTNTNQGTCMDYTNVPGGTPSNTHPYAHDYEQLESIYAHADSTTTVGASAPSGPGKPSRARVENVDSRGNGTITWTYWVR